MLFTIEYNLTFLWTLLLEAAMVQQGEALLENLIKVKEGNGLCFWEGVAKINKQHFLSKMLHEFLYLQLYLRKLCANFSKKN
uniref:Putative secreted protein n=1 Tax=Panstrongylus lignarius TaxID=156445 RepID=A0A224XSM4_9HEMI